jgi:hypothetical protein
MSQGATYKIPTVFFVLEILFAVFSLLKKYMYFHKSKMEVAKKHALSILYCCLASFNHCQLGSTKHIQISPTSAVFLYPEYHKVKGNLKINYLFYFWSLINPYLALTIYPQLGGRQSNIIIDFNKFSDTYI